MENPENQINPDVAKETENTSLLDQIIKTANNSNSPIGNTPTEGTPVNPTENN